MNDATARSYLFVPGNRPQWFASALASGADRIIIDLEDAVAAADKASARLALAQWIGADEAARQRVLIRINGLDSVCHGDDLALLEAVPAACVMLPKCQSAGQVAALRASLRRETAVVALIESARGVLASPDIAVAPGVVRLAFGALDYMVDLDIALPPDADGAGNRALDFAAAQIAVASRAAGLPSPIAGVTAAIDAAQVRRDMLHARGLGYGAKMCIHPSQVPAVHAALLPSAQELAWAQRVVREWSAAGTGAIQVDGAMVDRPLFLKARQIVARSAPER